MPLFSTPQAGNVRTAVYPGDKYVLFDGTETPSVGLKSVAFNRAPGNMQSGNGMVFTVDFASAPTATVQIQGANTDAEANYQILSTISTQHGYYADLGLFCFYRCVLSAYGAGGQPIVTVQR